MVAGGNISLPSIVVVFPPPGVAVAEEISMGRPEEDLDSSLTNGKEEEGGAVRALAGVTGVLAEVEVRLLTVFLFFFKIASMALISSLTRISSCSSSFVLNE
jgi:hypothetical protein